MTVLQIVFKPQPVLREKSTEIEEINDEIKKLAADMLDTMHESKGVGLAAVQVGVAKRLIVIDIPKQDEERTPMILVNPEILTSSKKRSFFREGCLSIPGIMADIDRPSEVTIQYRDLDGNRRVINASGVLATCLQHEIDHLNGVLFTDYLETY
ncbi:peptide deformylase [Rhizobium ruizarguesonis]|uniref:peptide deformylase n=1 Tax=Rhizobium ruizarguesonis TaxID=2081791 RepID=UPI00102F346E|nr:peptide deformylase [Rhizobium ruizarguesonis]TAT96083.1 peptide deformylase [Rhizobium ruizarguesonis]